MHLGFTRKGIVLIQIKCHGETQNVAASFQWLRDNPDHIIIAFRNDNVLEYGLTEAGFLPKEIKALTEGEKCRILIAGGPRTGKTTLANSVEIDPQFVHHGDDLIGKLEWSEASEEISTWFDKPGSWIIEGVQVARALRKWLSRNETGKPCDTIYYGFTPFVDLIDGQRSMKKGCDTVWFEVQDELLKRGVEISLIPRNERQAKA